LQSGLRIGEAVALRHADVDGPAPLAGPQRCSR
jgi:hypothetical protein